ncbi:MAG: hypothetical protein IIB95_07900 [Candidatus Marinimicrobia bacterium]|nr:hypothetical protein [Candidatus Neomarinimicrobiota bacterium]
MFDLLVLVFIGISLAVLILTVNLAWPKFFTAFNKANRKIYLKDAFVSLFCAIGLFSIIAAISGLLTIYHPTFIEPDTFRVPTITSYYPLVDLLHDMVSGNFIIMLLIVSIFYIYRQLTVRGGIRKILVLSAIAIPFVLPNEPEILYFFSYALWIGAVFFLIRYFWSGNPWSYLFGVFGFFTIPDILGYFSKIQDPTYRIQGYAAAAIVFFILLYFAKEAFSQD